jgi:hypothetical protein
MSMKEIKAKYTKSEIALLAWDSRLKSYNIGLGLKDTSTGVSKGKLTQLPPPKNYPDNLISPAGVKETEHTYVLPEGVNNGAPIPKDFFDEEGEIDLRQVTGDRAAQYLNAIGIPLVVVPQRGKK